MEEAQNSQLLVAYGQWVVRQCLCPCRGSIAKQTEEDTRSPVYKDQSGSISSVHDTRLITWPLDDLFLVVYQDNIQHGHLEEKTWRKATILLQLLLQL